MSVENQAWPKVIRISLSLDLHRFRSHLKHFNIDLAQSRVTERSEVTRRYSSASKTTGHLFTFFHEDTPSLQILGVLWDKGSFCESFAVTLLSFFPLGYLPGFH